MDTGDTDFIQQLQIHPKAAAIAALAIAEAARFTLSFKEAADFIADTTAEESQAETLENARNSYPTLPVDNYKEIVKHARRLLNITGVGRLAYETAEAAYSKYVGLYGAATEPDSSEEKAISYWNAIQNDPLLTSTFTALFSELSAQQ